MPGGVKLRKERREREREIERPILAFVVDTKRIIDEATLQNSTATGNCDASTRAALIVQTRDYIQVIDLNVLMCAIGK